MWRGSSERILKPPPPKDTTGLTAASRDSPYSARTYSWVRATDTCTRPVSAFNEPKPVPSSTRSRAVRARAANTSPRNPARPWTYDSGLKLYTNPTKLPRPPNTHPSTALGNVTATATRASSPEPRIRTSSDPVRRGSSLTTPRESTTDAALTRIDCPAALAPRSVSATSFPYWSRATTRSTMGARDCTASGPPPPPADAGTLSRNTTNSLGGPGSPYTIAVFVTGPTVPVTTTGPAPRPSVASTSTAP